MSTRPGAAGDATTSADERDAQGDDHSLIGGRDADVASKLAAAIEALRGSVEAERAAQGLTPRVADVLTLVRLADRIREARRKPAEGPPLHDQQDGRGHGVGDAVADRV